MHASGSAARRAAAQLRGMVLNCFVRAATQHRQMLREWHGREVVVVEAWSIQGAV